MLFNIVFASLVTACFSFSKIPMVSYIHKFDNNLDNVKIFEPYHTNKENTPCILFFTGGSSLVIPEIYNNLFSKIVSNNIAVCAPPFKYQNLDNLITNLDNEYSEVILAGHSSGVSTALNNNNKKINKLISLDGVDTRIFSLNQNNKFNIKNINSVLFLNAGKSYKYTDDPPGVAFIPFLALEKTAIDIGSHCKILEIEAEKYGHCDILDRSYSNLMHKTRLSVGNSNRSHDNLDNYHTWIGSIISNFINRRYNKIKKLDRKLNI